ncbi:MAG TPA: 2-phosphosulfolactate phosphatase [Candidatus Baltobacteraceae bacterium]|nr:2-phosphosulfolactate phosphatase [Candidatus Baltobacteraceae bacterium]
MPRVHVLTNKTHTEPQRLVGVIAVVVDVIFATTAIALMLDRGASEIIPTLTPEVARDRARELQRGAYLLVGEQHGEVIPGFLEPWPTELCRIDLTRKTVLYSTTNGTVALNYAASAGLVLAAAPVNAAAVVEYIASHHDERNVVLICAGSGTAFSLEDFYGAGRLVSLLATSTRHFHLSDSANAARLLHENVESASCIEDTYAGRMMAAQDRREDLKFCGQRDVLNTVPVFSGGRIRRA